MAQAKGKDSARENGKQDAIALLKADHRQVEEWFEEFETAQSDDRKQVLADNICEALTIHTTIEEEIFYPAFLEATDDQDIHHEAEIEHEGAKRLIADIEASSPADEYFDSMVKVLSEMIKHHVKEEEQPEGMFSKARDSDMDLAALGEQLAARKEELESTVSDDSADADADADEEDEGSLPGKTGAKDRDSVRGDGRQTRPSRQT